MDKIMAKQLGEVVCTPEQVETVRTLLKRIPIYIIKIHDVHGQKVVRFRFYKHQQTKIQKLMSKLSDEQTVSELKKKIGYEALATNYSGLIHDLDAVADIFFQRA